MKGMDSGWDPQDLMIYRAAFEESRDAILFTDHSGRLVDCNLACVQLFRAQQKGDILQGHPSALSPPKQPDGSPSEEAADARIRRAFEQGSTFFRWTHQTLEGEPVRCEVLLTRIDTGPQQLLQAVVRELGPRERQYEAIFNQTDQFIALMTPDGTLLEVNDTALRFTGLPREQLVGTGLSAGSWWGGSEVVRARIPEAVQRAARGEFVRTEAEILGSGSRIITDFSIRPIFDEYDRVHYLLAEGKDITERIRMERHLKSLAYSDTVTDLPNRRALRERLEAFQRDAAPGDSLGLIFLDLASFSSINASLGHAIGDRVLQAASERLSEVAEGDWMLARFSGDKFAVAVPGASDEEAIRAVAERIQQAFKQAVTVDGREFILAAGFGASGWPDSAEQVETLIQQAETALRHSRANDNAFTFFRLELVDDVQERLQLGTELQRELDQGGVNLAVRYQPKVDLRDGSCIGFEVLARWHHPDRGWVPPSTFVTVAESAGVIRALGEWVLREACRQGQAWLEHGYEFGRIAVNVSAVQLRDAEFIAVLTKILAETGFPPDGLEIELTESALVGEDRLTVHQLRAARSMGVTVALDDFGTGYSSMSYLKDLPIDRLKVDRAFVDPMVQDPRARAITGAILALGQALGYAVIAEGVETDAHWALLLEDGFLEGQGYGFARPMTAADVTQRWLNADRKAN